MIERVIEGEREREVKGETKMERKKTPRVPPIYSQPFFFLLLLLFFYLEYVCVVDTCLLFGCRTRIRGNMLCTPQLPFRRKP